MPEGRKARIALIGAGRWSRGWHIPQIVNNPSSELAALASGRMVPELSKEFGVPGFKNVDELLADPVAKTLDGIIIASPHANHQEIGMKCLDAGMNIFMEKPMTTDLPEALQLTEAAIAKGKIFMVNNTANWRKSAATATQMIERGDIGKIRHAMVMFATPLGFLFNDPTQEGWVKPSGNMIGNGFAWGQLAHTFGWLWMVSGLKPKEVFAYMGKGDKTEADIYDSASILCENGATVSVSACGVIPGKSKLVQNRLFGDQGMLNYSGSYEIDEGDAHEEGKAEAPKTEGELKLERFDGKNVVDKGFEFENIEQGGTGPESLQAFIDAVLGKPHFKGTTAEIGFLCVATIDAMYRSAKSGKSEPLIPAGMSIPKGLSVRKARIALIGAGRWSRGWHIPQLVNNPNSELAALASGRMVPDLSKEFGVPGFKDVDALLADPVAATLDGIIIASPHANHYEIGMKCLKAGMNIFMEKPMTTDLPEALELTTTANGVGKVFMVNNTANWRAAAYRATKLIEQGEIGEIRHALVMFATPLGFLFNDPTQEGWVKPSGNMIGNGFAWGQLAHTFGWLWMVSGLKPKEVFAYMGKGDKTDADIYDSASILCENGATVSVSACGVIPGKSKIVQNRIFGKDGMLSYSGSYEIDEGDAHEEGKTGGPKTEGDLRLERFDGKNFVDEGFEFENIEQGGTGPESLQAFIDACQGKPYFKGTSADIGFLCVATIDAMYRSAKSGKSEPLLMPGMTAPWTRPAAKSEIV